jgi:Cdc6-like AAA superfamily ATPase
MLSNTARNQTINLDDEISFVSYSGMLIYGDRNCGKTYEVLKILEKYSHMYVDMRLYDDPNRAVEQIVNNFNEINPQPLFLLIRDGIQFYEHLQYLS